MTATPDQITRPRKPRRGRHPLRRRLRRRHAADRCPLHRASARAGNDLATLPDFPAKIRAPAGTIAGVSVPGAHLRPRHRHTRRRAERADGDEPGRAQGQPRDLDGGVDDPRQLRPVHRQEPHPRRLQGQPGRRWIAASYKVDQVRSRASPSRSCKDLGVSRATPSGGRTSSRSVSSPGCTTVARPHPQVDRPEVSGHARGADANRARSRPGTTTVRPSRSSRTPDPARESSLVVYRNITGNHALAYGLVAAAQQSEPAILYASIRSRPRPTSCTSCRSTRTSASAPSRRKTRSPPSAGPWARRSQAARRHRHQRSGPRAQVRGVGLAVMPRAAASGHRRAARRSVDRSAHQDRAVRSAPCHVWPQRRVRRCRSSRRVRPSHCFDAAHEAVRIASST